MLAFVIILAVLLPFIVGFVCYHLSIRRERILYREKYSAMRKYLFDGKEDHDENSIDDATGSPSDKC